MTKADAILVLQRAAEALVHQLPADAVVRWVAVEVKCAPERTEP